MMKYAKRFLNVAVALLLVIVILFPLYWLVITSLKPPSEIFRESTNILPGSITFENYSVVFERTSIFRYFLNSVFVSLVTVFICISIAACAAYAVSRYAFKGKKAFFFIMLTSQMLPLTTLIIPLYMIWSKAGLLDSHISIIVTYGGFFIPVGIWLLTSYFQSIPREIDEAAILDGCSVLMRLRLIILPLALPGLMAASLSIIISTWQELMISMTFLQSENLRTLPAGVISFITRQGIQWGPLTAAGVIACIPIMILYVLLQKALIGGLTEGATKG